MQKNQRHSKGKMYALIRKWEASGLSQEQFLRRHGIAKSTFGYWRKKYLKETGDNKRKENFIPVKIDKADKTQKGTEVCIHPTKQVIANSENIL